MAVAYVQSKAAHVATAGTTVSVTLDSPVTPGSTIVVFLFWNSSTQTASVADGLGNSYTAPPSPNGNAFTGSGALAGFRIQAFAAFGVDGAPTVTATFSGSNTDRAIAVHEVSGVASWDAAAYANVTASGGAFTTGSVTTTVASDYLFLGALAQGSVSTVTSPFTMRVSGSTFANNATGDRTASAAGSYSGSGTTAGASEVLATVVAAFKPTSSAATATPAATSGTVTVPLSAASLGGAAAFVQWKGNAAGPAASGTTIAATFDTNVTAGHGIVVFAIWDDITGTATVSDGHNTYVPCGSPHNGAGALAALRVQVFAAFNCAAGATTVTATFSNTNTDRTIAIHEVANITAYDNSTYANVNSVANVFTSGAVTPSQADTYLFLGAHVEHTVSTVTSPFTIRGSGAPIANNGTGDRVVSSIASYTASGTSSSPTDALNTALVAFVGGSVTASPKARPRTVLSQAAQRAASW